MFLVHVFYTVAGVLVHRDTAYDVEKRCRNISDNKMI